MDSYLSRRIYRSSAIGTNDFAQSLSEPVAKFLQFTSAQNLTVQVSSKHIPITTQVNPNPLPIIFRPRITCEIYREIAAE